MESKLIAPSTLHTFDIPLSAVKKTTGFSFDFGNSAIKIGYALPMEDKVRLHFVSFSINKMEEALHFIQESVGEFIKPGEEVIITGFGGNTHKDKIEEKLNIRTNLCSEIDCHVAGFLFMSKYCCLQELLHPPSKAVQDYAWPAAKGQLECLQAFCTLADDIPMQTKQINQAEPLVCITETIVFPALLFMIGSNTATILVYENGSHEMIDYNADGGKCLLGNASLIAQSFEELERLAECGNSNKMNQMMNDLVDDSKVDIYTQSLQVTSSHNIPVYFLGHAAGHKLDDFSHEDRAAALISLTAYNIAVYCQMWSMFFKAKDVYFIGGLHSSSQLLRDEIGKQFAHHSLMSYSGVYTEHHFVKSSVYLGALGSLLKNLGLPE